MTRPLPLEWQAPPADLPQVRKRFFALAWHRQLAVREAAYDIYLGGRSGVPSCWTRALGQDVLRHRHAEVTP